MEAWFGAILIALSGWQMDLYSKDEIREAAWITEIVGRRGFHNSKIVRDTCAMNWRMNGQIAKALDEMPEGIREIAWRSPRSVDGYVFEICCAPFGSFGLLFTPETSSRHQRVVGFSCG